MKLKILVYSAFALFTGLVSRVQAQDCCGGTPLPTGDTCCFDTTAYPTNIADTCCSPAQEASWQQQYNTCDSGVRSTYQGQLSDAWTNYQAVNKAAEDDVSAGCTVCCGALGSVGYGVCWALAQPGLDEIELANKETYEAKVFDDWSAAEIADSLCWNDDPGSGPPYCYDGWILTANPNSLSQPGS